MLCIKKILIVPLAAVMLATLLAVAPTSSPDVPVLSTLQTEPADAHTYLEETGIYVTQCDTSGVCRYVEKLSPKPHWHGWEEVCQIVSIVVGGGAAAKAGKWLGRFAGSVGAGLVTLYERVCQTVEKIIWAL